MTSERCHPNSGLTLTVETLRFNVRRWHFFWLYRIQFLLTLLANPANPSSRAIRALWDTGLPALRQIPFTTAGSSCSTVEG